MANTITSVNSFPNDVRDAFQAYIKSPGHANRERIPYEKWRRMHIFLDNPSLKPENPADSNIKHRSITEFDLILNKLYRRPYKSFKEPRYVVPESEALDLIIKEHLRLLHAGCDKTWTAIQQKYYGVSRQEVRFVIKLCKSCASNGPAVTKAPLQPIVSEWGWERAQVDLIDMRHEPSGQYKWILHIIDHFSKYTQLYPLKTMHAEPIAEALMQFIAAFLPPKIVQADCGKEFEDALLILLRKYRIQVVNGGPRSPQTQGLIGQANRVVESKLKAWKLENGSTEWATGLGRVTIAINTQKHPTIGCTPAELLFREKHWFIDWINSQKRKDITIGVAQKDPTLSPISALSSRSNSSRINIEIQGNSQVTIQISLETGSQINLRITPPTRNFPEKQFDLETSKHGRGLGIEPEPELGQNSSNLVLEIAQKSTQNARDRMVNNHDIQHFNIEDIVAIKVPGAELTSTDNMRLSGDILEGPHSHQYKVVTLSGNIRLLIPTKEPGVVDQALLPDVTILDSTDKASLGQAAKDASTSQQVGVSCQCKGLCSTKRCHCFKENRKCSEHCHGDEHGCDNLSGLAIRTETTLAKRPGRKRARANTAGNVV